MNSDVYFGAYTSAFFVCSFRQFPSEEEAPGRRSGAGPEAGQGAGLEDGREVLLEEEEETEGGEVPESKRTLAESVRHDVIEKRLIYKRLAAISVFPGYESVFGMMLGMNAVWLLMASDEQLRAKWMRPATGVPQQRLYAVFMGKQALSRISWKLKGYRVYDFICGWLAWGRPVTLRFKGHFTAAVKCNLPVERGDLDVIGLQFLRRDRVWGIAHEVVPPERFGEGYDVSDARCSSDKAHQSV
ncbi:hypothetical protein Cadr_000024361 [Camelus dromedarius]|uniref:Uncharacterized protein n=1 Tax=Camelus dromedarius TaxID=9838 RepID=A0A5N4CPG8_CAMDR|nr:hypothetical protein Cadr_000024361 [Camelus dromedarius]